MRSLSVQIGLAMVLGAFLGFVLGPSAAPLGEIGKAVITLIKAIASPLLFFTIIHHISTTDVHWKGAARMLVAASVNATFALAIGLGLSNLIQPGRHLSLDVLHAQTAAAGASTAAAMPVKAPTHLDLPGVLSALIPSSLVQPFVDNAVLALVFLAVMIGLSLRKVRATQQAEGRRDYIAFDSAIETARELSVTAIQAVVHLVPLAVLGVVAKSVASYGFAPIKGLGVYVGVGLLGLTLQVVVYQLWFVLYVRRFTLGEFWRQVREPVVYAFGANSSLATLPLTLKALDRLKISRASSTLGACVGSNLNHDGIILYEAMAALLVAQAAGIDLSLGQQILVAATALVASAGIAGIPEAGFISLAVVLGTVGVPTELLPLLLTVDWIIARGRSVVNVLSDITLSILIERMGSPAPESRGKLQEISG